MADTGIMQIKKYFGYESVKAFRDDWNMLTDEDKEQIRSGILNGSLTY